MLYEIAHIIKERFGFLWDAIEWGNAEVFALMHRGEMKRIPELLAECSGRYQLRLATREDVEQMRAFFEAQPKEAFRFFQPHEFDEKGIKKVIANKSFLTFLAIDEGRKRKLFEPLEPFELFKRSCDSRLLLHALVCER